MILVLVLQAELLHITPHGTGDVVLKADTVTVGDAAAAATLRSSGAGTLTLATGGTTDVILSLQIMVQLQEQ